MILRQSYRDWQEAIRAIITQLLSLFDVENTWNGKQTFGAGVHVKAGTAAANTAPVKLTSGPLNTTAEAGAIEFLTDAYYATITTGAARKTIAFLEAPTFTGTTNLSGGVKIVGASIAEILTATAALDFLSIAAAASADLSITLTGAAVNDGVTLGLPAAPTAGIVYQAFVSAANTVTVRATNITGAAIDPASQTFRVVTIGY